jgi:esterase/lipase superfamily enzyme
MQVSHHKFYSNSLGQDFELKAYGHDGKPVMVFPTSCGRFWDYEDHGMIASLAPYIDAGEIRLFSVDGRDNESWYKPTRDEWIGIRHGHYEGCVINEAIPYIRHHFGVGEKFLATGNSFGAYHSANFFLKYPDYFDSALCLSGVYKMQTELGGYFDSGVYYNDPVSYMPGQHDEGFLNKLRDGYIVIAHGEGAWETFNDQAASLAHTLGQKGIPCWYDRWGQQWPHDWETWHAQVHKFFPAFRDGVAWRGGTLRVTGPHRRYNPLP